MPKPKILVISFSPLDRDPRVRRQLLTLSNYNYDLVAAGFTDPSIEGVEWWEIKSTKLSFFGKIKTAAMLKVRLYSSYYQQLETVRSLIKEWKSRNKPVFDLVIANDVESLPVALTISGENPVLIDAHEYAPSQTGSRAWRFISENYIHWQCKTFLSKASAMSTVCGGIAELYSKNYGVQAFLTHNAPDYSELTPSDIAPEQITLVHHGIANPQRKLEIMINMLALLDERFTLSFYLVENSSKASNYLNWLKSHAEKLNLSHRVIFNAPIATDKIVSELNQFDIGIFPLEPNCLNSQLVLPNKFFEFIQARLAVVIGPSPEMVKLLRRYNVGAVAENFSAQAMANAISNMSIDELTQYKKNTNLAAKKLNFSEDVPQLINTIQDLLRK